MANLIQSVVPRKNYIVEAVFYDGSVKQFDMKSLFQSYPQFQEFQTNRGLFERVTVDAGGYGITWNDELDLSCEAIWDEGLLVEKLKESDLSHLLAYHLSSIRESRHMTQAELSEKTGIYQADISKIERAIGNPSISTLKRLGEGLGAELKIDFTIKTEKE
ncbi:MAG: DUF2442 domain-containing protein [Lachnospiraceae bacterium]|nr:DUF2442 domain-containing protein [Lachnospiraceae bacterium]